MPTHKKLTRCSPRQTSTHYGCPPNDEKSLKDLVPVKGPTQAFKWLRWHLALFVPLGGAEQGANVCPRCDLINTEKELSAPAAHNGPDRRASADQRSPNRCERQHADQHPRCGAIANDRGKAAPSAPPTWKRVYRDLRSLQKHQSYADGLQNVRFPARGTVSQAANRSIRNRPARAESHR